MSDHTDELGELDDELDAKKKDEKESVATQLVKLALEADIELWHTPADEPFATVPVNDRRETWALKSRAVRRWLSRAYYLATEKAAGEQAIRDALSVLSGMALFEGEEHEVHVRVAGFDDRAYLDLADEHWQAVEISAGGWKVVANPPVRFRRARGMLALPAPVAGGSLDALKPLLNYGSEDDFRLMVSWLLMAFRPAGPYPVLDLLGEQGSGKSSAVEVLRMLVDPNEALLRPAPRDERDLVIAGSNGRVVALENLSRVDQWLSDAICRIATGTGFATRELFTDSDEAIFHVQLPVALNGIVEHVHAGDLQDRSIVLVLPPIEEYTPESDLWGAFELAHPRLLGALLDVVAAALAEEPNVELEDPPRMADFARFVAAACPALGWDPDDWLRAYADNRANASEAVLGASPLVAPLRRLGEWEGSATDLLSELVSIVSDDDGHIARSKDWPKSPSALAGALRRLAPNLRRGAPPLEVEFDRVAKGQRVVRLVQP